MPIGDQVEDRIVAIMKRFGYTGSVHVYMYCLMNIPLPDMNWPLAVAYQSAIYGVPSSRASWTCECDSGQPVRYVPIPAARLVAHLETRFARDIDDPEGMDQIVETQAEAITWTVTGYDSVLAEAALISGARESVICSLWTREAEQLSGR